MGRTLLLRITAPHFCAGVEAPILSYMQGWALDKIRAYCLRKHWQLEEIEMEGDTPEKIFERDKAFATSLAAKITTAVFAKLECEKQYTTIIRFENYEGLPYPWITIAFVRIGKPAETESSVSLPMARYMDTLNDATVRSELATLIYKNIAVMLGRYKPK